MNNIFLPSNDPLLYTPNNYYPHNIQEKMEQKYNEYLARTQQRPDLLAELDNKLKNLNSSVEKELESDLEFKDLSSILHNNIQAEIMAMVKQQINNNPEMVKNIERQLTIIKNIENKISESERKNMAELNDYLQNYSNITFDEYKKLKAELNEN